MMLVGIAVVRNESDVIELCVRHNLQFVDLMYVMDNGSTDGTREILRRLVHEGLPLVVCDEPQVGHFQSERMSAMLRNAGLMFRPDFSILLDADELLAVPSRAELARWLAAIPANAHGVLPWRTYVFREQDDPNLANVALRMQHRRRTESPVYYKAVAAHCGLDLSSTVVEAGNHSIFDTRHGRVPHYQLGPLAMAHFPVRSPLQLSAKALSGWLAQLAKNPRAAETGEAFHWRQMYERVMTDGMLDAATVAEISARYAQPTQAAGTALRPAAELVHDPLPVSATLRYAEIAVKSDLVRTVAATAQMILAPLPSVPRGLAAPGAGIVDLPAWRWVFERLQPASLLEMSQAVGGVTACARHLGVPVCLEEPWHADAALAPSAVDLAVCLQLPPGVSPNQLLDRLCACAAQMVVFCPSQPNAAAVSSVSDWLSLWAIRGWHPDVFETLALRSLCKSQALRQGALVLRRNPMAFGRGVASLRVLEAPLRAAAREADEIVGCVMDWMPTPPGLAASLEVVAA